MSSLVLESNLIIAIAVAAILCWFPRLWFRTDARLRTVIHIVAWTTACCMVALNALARPIYDDEVFYMAQAFSARHDELSAYLPLRVWSYYPFLALHISPAATILASRIIMIFAALFAGVLVMSIGRRIDGSGCTASLAGALATLSFGNLPMGTMVPEYIAFLFLLIAIWAMLAAPARWPRGLSLFVCGFMMSFACTTSLRLVLFGVATDYCVRADALALRRRGFQLDLVVDAIQAITAEGGRQALEEMAAAGVRQVTTAEVCQSFPLPIVPKG